MEQKKIHRLQAQLAEAGMKALAAVVCTEISRQEMATMDLFSQRSQGWDQNQQPTQPTLTLSST
nr:MULTISPECIES: hypothetical protein [unclassified Synechococcus]